MKRYQARVRKMNDAYYALLVRIDKDGEEVVAHGYKGRYFATEAAARRSIDRHIAKHDLP